MPVSPLPPRPAQVKPGRKTRRRLAPAPRGGYHGRHVTIFRENLMHPSLRTLAALALAGALLAALAAPAAARTVRLGIVTTPGSAQHVCATAFQELVAERSGGTTAVKVFHSGSLGSETDILRQVQMGAVDMAIVTLGPLDTFVPEAAVVGFPFLFSSPEQADAVLDGPLGAEVLAAMERAGFKGLAFSENGFRNLTNAVRPVHTVDDVRGLKIRVMESALDRELWQALGANPTPMAWPVYTELQQGTIDGQENPLSVIWLYRLHEVQPHLSLTGHVYSAHVGLAGLPWWNALAPAEQALLADALRDAARAQRAWNRAGEADFLARLREAGMTVDEHPDLESFKARTRGLRELPAYADPRVRALLDRFLDATRPTQGDTQ